MPQSGPPALPASAALIDERRGQAPAASRFFTDGVMDGVSRGRMAAETAAGRPALCLRGEVRPDSSGGFIQLALELPSPLHGPGAVSNSTCRATDAAMACARTADMNRPCRAWRAAFTAEVCVARLAWLR